MKTLIDSIPDFHYNYKKLPDSVHVYCIDPQLIN